MKMELHTSGNFSGWKSPRNVISNWDWKTGACGLSLYTSWWAVTPRTLTVAVLTWRPRNVCLCYNKSLINQLEHLLLLIEFLSISGLINSFQWILSLTSVQFSLLSSNTGTPICPLCNLRLGLVLPHSYRVWVFNVCFLIIFFLLWGLEKQPKKAFAFSQRIAQSAQAVKGKLYPLFSEKENGNWRPFPTPLQSLRTFALSKDISTLGCGNIFFWIMI